jgi:hypothetical protein
MRVYVKEPGKKPELKDEKVTLEWLNKMVGGYIELYPIAGDAAIVCNEEGKITGLPDNFTFLDFRKGKIQRMESFVGTVVFVGLKNAKEGVDFDDFKGTLPSFDSTLVQK